MTDRKNDLSHHTLLLGVMGDPIGHSKSPAMHNIALEASGIPGMYVPLHVKPEQLAEAVAGTKALGFSGFNVTIPHKVEMLKLMDELDESAVCCGAVNTVVIQNGKLKGYNTDGIGYVRSLKEELNSELSGKHITILGAGGAARGVVYALLREQPASVTVINRTVDKAEQLATEFSNDNLQVQSGSYEALDKVLSQTDILINTTSIGMSPNSDETPLEQSRIPEGIIVSDLIYNPLETRFLREAKSRGCTVVGGLGMFVYQGAYAYEYWTGQPAPVSVMRSALLEAMNHQKE